MSESTRADHPIYSLLPTEIDGYDSLAELALDLRWSWNHATDNVWRELDPELWEITHNPWVVLQTQRLLVRWCSFRSAADRKEHEKREPSTPQRLRETTLSKSRALLFEEGSFRGGPHLDGLRITSVAHGPEASRFLTPLSSHTLRKRFRTARRALGLTTFGP